VGATIVTTSSDLPESTAARETLRRPSGESAWVGFAGFVLVVGVLYWAQAVLVPIALAGLLAFLLAPVVGTLQRLVGRVAAVLVVVAVTAGALGFGGWSLVRQASGMVDALPEYRANIRRKVADVRGAGQGGAVEKIQRTVDGIKADMVGPDAARAAAGRPVVVTSEQVSDPWGLPAWLGPVMAPLATAGLVVVLVIFMLLERENLRNRLLVLLGSGTLAVTTRALDEAARRVSRYLLMMSVVNLLFGIGVATGLTLIGVPYALLWAALAALLRFIPYVGVWIGAGTPLLVSLAALPGWHAAALVVALFAVIEIFTSVVLETVLYADAAGVSQVALLVAVAFWAWLWGAPGLLLATPLTVCLVVIGKHFPGLQPLATLLADTPPLEPSVRCYQRLLVRDYGEAASLVEEHVATHPVETVFDALLIPVLAYAKRDRLEGRLTADDVREVVVAVRELVRDAVALLPDASASAASGAGAPARVLGFAVGGEIDAPAMEMLRALLAGAAVELDLAPSRLLPSELVTHVAASAYDVVCLVDLPPSSPAKVRYLVRKLRSSMSGRVVLVGRWAPDDLRDESPRLLLEAGARQVAATLLETRDQLVGVVCDVGPVAADDMRPVASGGAIGPRAGAL
jgi:predicted PurR-regulated permease PerM